VTGAAARRPDTGPPATGADERATLVGFLDYLRAAVVAKVEGVPEPQVRTAGVPSGTNLLGLVTHLTAVERLYLHGVPITSFARTFRPTASQTVDGVLAAYRDTTAASNAVVAACADLGDPAPRARGRDAAPSMRWVLVHLIEETARHAGHLDILREQIDGATGR
jgi:hypothetical protein